MSYARICALLCLAVAAANGQENVRPRIDVGKSVVEDPLKKAISGRFRDTIRATSSRDLPAPQPGQSSDNPRVAAGKVAWHPDMETAAAAAHRSGKPVLLFQMMGNLDEKFC